MAKWKSYSIPVELEEKIKLVVKTRPDLYTSVADFIRDACAAKIRELESENVKRSLHSESHVQER